MDGRGMLREDLWDRCVERLEAEIPGKEIGTWIRPLRAVVSADQVTLLAPNRVVMERVRTDFLQKIQRAVSSLAAYDLIVNIAVGSAAETRPVAFGNATGTAAAEADDYSPFVKGRL